jgi:threonine/homoserine/homoserine lactone efflux protein
MQSIITISIVGLIVGFIFSMPIAGPISILITSNALKGRVRYCNMATLGASFADFVYVFAAVFGLTKFYSLYQPVIPYILLIGTVFLIFLGYKITKTKVDLEHIDEKSHLPGAVKKREKNGFWAGFLLNFLNPTLFIGWLTSSFIVISLVAALGFNTGGLDKNVDKSFSSINKTAEDSALKNKTLSYFHINASKIKQERAATEAAKEPRYLSLLLSLSYAFFLSIGSIIWFFYLAYILAKHRHRINVNTVNNIIRGLGLVLCIFGLFLGYKAITMLIHP